MLQAHGPLKKGSIYLPAPTSSRARASPGSINCLLVMDHLWKLKDRIAQHSFREVWGLITRDIGCGRSRCKTGCHRNDWSTKLAESCLTHSFSIDQTHYKGIKGKQTRSITALGSVRGLTKIRGEMTISIKLGLSHAHLHFHCKISE